MQQLKKKKSKTCSVKESNKQNSFFIIQIYRNRMGTDTANEHRLRLSWEREIDEWKMIKLPRKGKTLYIVIHMVVTLFPVY